MSERYAFDRKADFLSKLEALIDQGVKPSRMTVITPFHVHETEHLLREKPSKLKYFAFGGAMTGMAAGFALTILTVLHWPIITGGKPLVSIPPFIIIAFALTILIGSLISFGGFLFLAKLPSPKAILAPEEHDNRFIIICEPESEG